MVAVRIDNKIYTAKTAHEMVMQLKLEDWTKYKSTNEYKQNIKRRVRIFNGERIQFETDEEFLLELKRIGFLENIRFL